MRKSLLVIFLVAAAVFAMGVSNGQAGTITAVEKFVTLTKPLCLDTLDNAGLFVRDGFPGDGWAVYPFQDQYGLNIRIPLSDFVFLADNVEALDGNDQVLDFVPFNGPKEFAGPVKVTVYVERDPIGAPDTWTEALTFSATMGVRRQATIRRQFAYVNSFSTLNKRNQIVDNFHVNWNNSNFLLTLSGLRYHNFGDNLPNTVLNTGLATYNDINQATDARQTGMQTIFDMDTNRFGFTFADFPQNVRVKIETSYTYQTKPPVVNVVTVKHNYGFSTSPVDDPDNNPTDLLFNGSSTLSTATVSGCDVPNGGLPFNKETERMTTRQTRLTPVLFDVTPVITP